MVGKFDSQFDMFNWSFSRVEDAKASLIFTIFISPHRYITFLVLVGSIDYNRVGGVNFFFFS